MKINTNEDNYYDYLLTVHVPVSNSISNKYEIFCIDLSEGLEILLDYAVKHDENIDRKKYINMTLTKNELTEYVENDWIDDYYGDGENYLSFFIMAEDCNFEEIA